MKTFVYVKLETNADVEAQIAACEGRHVQQVMYSSFMGALTQVCFTCQQIRGIIDWEGNRSWGGRRPLRTPGQER